MKEATQSKKSILLEYLKVIVLTLVITYGVLYFIQISRVQMTSMVPTFKEGNIVLVDKVLYKNSSPQRNDIVIVDYKDANQKEKHIIKRVMANNEDMSINIPEGKVFVMGDNRNNSLDSRRLGYFDFKEDVVGKVFFTVPFS